MLHTFVQLSPKLPILQPFTVVTGAGVGVAGAGVGVAGAGVGVAGAGAGVAGAGVGVAGAGGVGDGSSGGEVLGLFEAGTVAAASEQ